MSARRPTPTRSTPRPAHGPASSSDGRAPPPAGARIGKAKADPTTQAPGVVRLIAGHWRRTPLPVPLQDGLRPTPARLRETLFNWLGPTLQGKRVLDAFAGSGALGLEAASRGAHATLIEAHAGQARRLQDLVARLSEGALRATVRHDEALGWMARAAPGFDLILLDPPFAADLHARALAAAARLAPQGLIYVEHTRLLVDADLPLSWRLLKTSRAGAVFGHLISKAAGAPTST